jgi:diguanylate cyclase (GGDEF)-like protein/PAS domain S-box-containing protein
MMTMGTPTLAQHRWVAFSGAALATTAAAMLLSSSSPWLGHVAWLSATGCVAWAAHCLGRQRGETQQAHDRYQDALRALQATEATAPAGAHLLQAAFQHSQAPMVITDALDRIVMVNQAFARLCGMSTDALLGQSAELHGLAPLRPSHLPGVDQHLRDGTRWAGESAITAHDGAVHEMWLAVSALRDAQGRITHHNRVFQDIAPLKKQLRQMADQARHDSLTELPNRRAFSEHLFHAMARARREPKTLAVMAVDLDGFKAVNDTHGHHVGDLLLQQVARRLQACVRTTDIVCRLGGDEFMVILEGAGMPHEVERIGQRILTCLSEAYTLEGHHVKATPSIGLVVHQPHENEAALMQRADAAMYSAKRAGKCRMVLDLGDTPAPVEGRTTARVA